jgi:hypothetical protein
LTNVTGKANDQQVTRPGNLDLGAAAATLATRNLASQEQPQAQKYQ